MCYFTDQLNTFHILDDVELEKSIPAETHEIIDSFYDGRKTGLTWKDWWVPGGPVIYTISDYRKGDEKFEKMAQHSQAKWKAWQAGFKYGLNEAGLPWPSGKRPTSGFWA